MTDSLPYRCPDCGSRGRPTYTTGGVAPPATGNCRSIAVYCSDCDSLWGIAVVPLFTADVEVGLADDNAKLDREVVTPGDDLEQVIEDLEDDPDELEGFYLDLSGHRCPYCEGTVVPSTGLIPPTDGQHVLAVTAQYCPDCEAVLDVTWG